MDESREDRLDNLVEEQLRYLRGEGPQPDLSGFDNVERSEVLGLLEVVDALADSLPTSPAFEHDPVAVRLGLVNASPADASADDRSGDEPLWISLLELAARLGEAALRIEELPEPLTNSAGHRAAVICRSLVEVVAVVVFEGEPPAAGDAGTWLGRRPELSAVAFSSPDATRAAVVTPADASPHLVPAIGWREPVGLSWEPLGIALGRYFQQSMPSWDRVMTLSASDPIGNIADEAGPIAAAELSRLAGSRPQLAHKRSARDFVAGQEAIVITDFVDRVRTRQLPVEELTSELSELCEVAS